MEKAFSHLLSHLTILVILFQVSSVKGVAMVENSLINFDSNHRVLEML